MITGITGRTNRNHNGILYLALSDMLYDQIACASYCILNGMEIGKLYERGVRLLTPRNPKEPQGTPRNPKDT